MIGETWWSEKRIERDSGFAYESCENDSIFIWNKSSSSFQNEINCATKNVKKKKKDYLLQLKKRNKSKMNWI